MGWNGAERRRHPRVPAQVKVTYKEGNGETVMEAITNEVSTGGLSLDSPHPLPVGSVLRLTLEHPDLDGPLEILGTVVHSESVSGSSRAGVFIEGVPRSKEKVFETYLKWIKERVGASS